MCCDYWFVLPLVVLWRWDQFIHALFKLSSNGSSTTSFVSRCYGCHPKWKSRISGPLESHHGLLYLHRVWDLKSLVVLFVSLFCFFFCFWYYLICFKFAPYMFAKMLENDSLQRYSVSSRGFIVAITKYKVLSITQMSCQYVAELGI